MPSTEGREGTGGGGGAPPQVRLLLRAIGSLYGAIATWRRDWYARQPSRRRHLRQPVISVGNLSVGGTGKTPVVAYLARLLSEHGERPAILSRGYGRRRVRDGVTVVSDGASVLADVDVAGDEPFMLARALPGVPVLVASSRYLSGRLAEEKLGVTVHLLDDGFQHHELARDIDLLVVGEDDVNDRPLPAGRLREPLAAARCAAAVLVTAEYDAAADRIARALGVPTVFRVVRTTGAPRLISTGDTVVVPTDEPVFGVAGIAKPDQFFSDLASSGWRVAGSLAFRDHHWFTKRDVDQIKAEARTEGATIVMTTEKDAVRLGGRDFGALPVAAVPLKATIEPASGFASWLFARLDLARRTSHSAPSTTMVPPGKTMAPQ